MIPQIIKQISFTFTILILLGSQSFAQNSRKESNSGTKVLDFEADVIEGDKVRPDLFLDLKTDDLIIDDLLYMRNNFDDYYKIDTVKKPKAFL